MSAPLSRLEEITRASRRGSEALQVSSLLSEVVELDRAVDQVVRHVKYRS
ncbi:MAG: hypothetical protein RXQ98_07020 [Sulfolobaceae archaeon]|jgi:hypothetical protein